MMQPSDRPESIFTAAEANALLPKITSVVEQLQGIQRSLLQTTVQLNEVTGKLSQGNGYPIRSLKERLQELTKHQLQLINAFQSALDQLEQFGAVLKDLQTGLVDFYALREGELIFLCWKLGEGRIRYWHTLDGGYAARQLLE